MNSLESTVQRGARKYNKVQAEVPGNARFKEMQGSRKGNARTGLEQVSDHGTIWSQKTPHSEKMFELEKTSNKYSRWFPTDNQQINM